MNNPSNYRFAVQHTRGTFRASWLVPLLLLLALPAAVEAQFNYVTNNGTITITGYTGPSGAVTIPDTINGLPVTGIGDDAFYLCTGLTHVTIPNSVVSIGICAFASSGLTSAAIPSGVTRIGDWAFSFCHNLTNVAIGNTVMSIGWAPFCGCTSLAAITVDTLNPAYCSADGVLFNKTQTTLIQYPAGKSGGYMIPTRVGRIAAYAFTDCTGLANLTMPNSVTTIEDFAFEDCAGLTGLTIPNSVSSIGEYAFALCTSLTSVTLPASLTRVERDTFSYCTNLTRVTIPSCVNYIGDEAFEWCTSLTGVYFQGNAPSLGTRVFNYDWGAFAYYLSGTTGWGPGLDCLPTRLWLTPPSIQSSPLTQTAEARSAVDLRVRASGSVAPVCLWYFNGSNLLSCSTNNWLELTNVQFSQAGAYTAVVTNLTGAVTSAPALLQVILPVSRKPVPGIQVLGQTGTVVNVGYADYLSAAPNWTTLTSVSLTSSPQDWYDLTRPLPPQRFYRAWQTGAPAVVPSLDLRLVPAIGLMGNIGDRLRLDYINQFGPIDAWVTLATVTLTNSSQLYFDTSAVDQPPRLWRIVPVP